MLTQNSRLLVESFSRFPQTQRLSSMFLQARAMKRPSPQGHTLARDLIPAPPSLLPQEQQSQLELLQQLLRQLLWLVKSLSGSQRASPDGPSHLQTCPCWLSHPLSRPQTLAWSSVTALLPSCLPLPKQLLMLECSHHAACHQS